MLFAYAVACFVVTFLSDFSIPYQADKFEKFQLRTIYCTFKLNKIQIIIIKKNAENVLRERSSASFFVWQRGDADETEHKKKKKKSSKSNHRKQHARKHTDTIHRQEERTH